MASTGVGLEIDSDRRDGTVVLRARGELDLQTAAELCGPLDAEIRAPRSRVLVDLGDVTFCDSTGLRALMGVAREARVHRTRLVIVVPPDSGVARLVELTGVAEFLPLVADRHAGLRLLSPV
jgi:anti-sigma B factor antagonist